MWCVCSRQVVTMLFDLRRCRSVADRHNTMRHVKQTTAVVEVELATWHHFAAASSPAGGGCSGKLVEVIRHRQVCDTANIISGVSDNGFFVLRMAVKLMTPDATPTFCCLPENQKSEPCNDPTRVRICVRLWKKMPFIIRTGNSWHEKLGRIKIGKAEHAGRWIEGKGSIGDGFSQHLEQFVHSCLSN